MAYLKAEQVKDWANSQPDDATYCEFCLTRLAQNDEGLWYCPNKMCLWDEQVKIEETQSPTGEAKGG